MGSKQSTYLPPAMLPSRITSQEVPASISAERCKGRVNLASSAATATLTNFRSSSIPSRASGGSNPQVGEFRVSNSDLPCQFKGGFRTREKLGATAARQFRLAPLSPQPVRPKLLGHPVPPW